MLTNHFKKKQFDLNIAKTKRYPVKTVVLVSIICEYLLCKCQLKLFLATNI